MDARPIQIFKSLGLILEGLSEFGVPSFDWTSTRYAVEPENKLTTLWGKLKQQDLR